MSITWNDYKELKALREKLSERYEPIKYVGVGGFYKIFKLKDLILERVCALRVSHLEGTEAGRQKEMFLTMGLIFAKIKHPNIVTLYDVGNDSIYPYFIEEYVNGRTVLDIINENRKMSLQEIIRISRGVLAALGHLHQLGIIYRNVKPKKIMVKQGDGEVVLLNSGIAVKRSEPAENKKEPLIIGTPHYMAPEIIRGEPPVPETDIYAYGVSLYQMLSAELPFKDAAYDNVFKSHQEEAVPHIETIRSGLPKGIAEIIFKAMAKKPEDRYRNAREFLDALESLDYKENGTVSLKDDETIQSFNNGMLVEVLLKQLDERYKFIRELGRGATSIVCLLYDRVIEENVAIKIMDFGSISRIMDKVSTRKRSAEYEKKIAHFKREFRIYRQLKSPNIAKIFEVGLLNDKTGSMDIPFIIMEYVEGSTIKEILQEKGPFSFEQAVSISEGILGALSELHGSSIVHRDIKPSNIIVDKRSGGVKLLDFGIATHFADDDTRLTRTQEIAGTVAYMSPEQFTAGGVVFESDFYSFGITLFEMLTGKLPYRGDNMVEILSSHLNKKLPDVRKENSLLPSGIEKILYKATAKKPEKRYRSAQEFLDALLKLSRKPKEAGLLRKLWEKREPPAEEDRQLKEIKYLELKGEKEKVSQIRKELIDAESLNPLIYNEEIRYQIEKKNYWDALALIVTAEERKCVDQNTQALKEGVIEILSDDDYPALSKWAGDLQGAFELGRRNILQNADLVNGINGKLEATSIVTIYGIPGIGKSVLVQQVRESEPHKGRIYKWIDVDHEMTVHGLFEQLSTLLGFKEQFNLEEIDISEDPGFRFLGKDAKYRVPAFIHLGNAHRLYREGKFRDEALRNFLEAVIENYPDTKILLESSAPPPEGVFSEGIHQVGRYLGINENEVQLFFNQPFVNKPHVGWRLEGNELKMVLDYLAGNNEYKSVHPLGMFLLAHRAFEAGKTPVEILSFSHTMSELIDAAEELLLSDLNLETLESEDLDQDRTIEMYREDIPAFLFDTLNRTIGKLKGQPEPGPAEEENAEQEADKQEEELRSRITDGDYAGGRECLDKLLERSPDREGRLANEFGYIYDFQHPETETDNWIQNKNQLEWRRNIWQVLSGRNRFRLKTIEAKKETKNHRETKTEESRKDETVTVPESAYERKGKPPVQIGFDLEAPALSLVETFIAMCGQAYEIENVKKRRQRSGFQFGYDLEFACRIEGEQTMKLRIECKNYARELRLADIADKLATAKLDYSHDPIEHWIVLSPFARVANDLNRCLNAWEKNDEYPFKIQVWNYETNVDELFGLVPEIYDSFFKAEGDKPHPTTWSEEKKRGILETWKKKLEPPLGLPTAWQDYLRTPHKLTLEPRENEFETRYKKGDYVIMNCKDDTGTIQPQPLEEQIRDWLEEPVEQAPTLLLLGEFGDGKTFFTYILTRKLAEEFRESPKERWFPIRFALKNFDSEGFKSIQEFLQHRLNDFGVEIAGWNELRSKEIKILAILDGFDEISKELDPETIQRNIDILIECFENDYFKDMKLLITSRKHFFESHKEKDWLIDKLDGPRQLHLAPIDRKTTEDYLGKYAVEIGAEEKFKKIKEFHDPIGMASKPLFLEMVQVSLKDLPEKNLNEYTLYETYIQKSLKRKEKYQYDNKKKTPKGKIVENVLKVLELVARRLHQSNREYVFLSDIRGNTELKRWLWDISDPDKKTVEDETARAATRSLLKRVEVKKTEKDKQWPVDFCHRSIREYFVARAVSKMIEENPEEAKQFLAGCFLSHEILFFAGEIMKNRAFDYEPSLLKLIEKTRNVEQINRLKLGYQGGNAVNLLYRYSGKLPGDDWSRLVLDGAILPDADLSGKRFTHTSLQYANLDNANLTHSDFSYSNLTEVRIEETTPVQSIAISPEDKILALYHDGVIREWTYQRLQGAVPVNLTSRQEDDNVKDMKMAAQPGNDIMLFHDRKLFFYDRRQKELRQRAAWEMNSAFKLIKAKRDTLLLHERENGQNQLLLVDLHNQAIIKSYKCPPFSICDHLDDRAFAVCTEDDRVQLIDITSEGRKNRFLTTGEKISCIATCKSSKKDGEYLIGIGLFSGSIQIWQMKATGWETPAKILEHPMHKQPVKDICFMDDSRIVSGGLDKTIKRLTFDPDGRPVGEPIEFKMALQCKGMKIEGVIRDEEKRKLREFIDKAAH